MTDMAQQEYTIKGTAGTIYAGERSFFIAFLHYRHSICHDLSSEPSSLLCPAGVDTVCHTSSRI